MSLSFAGRSLFVRILFTALPLVGVACAPQRRITGEPVLYGIDPLSGAVVDRDVLTRENDPRLGVIPHKGEVISLVLNNVFVAHLEGRLNSRVLVYAEVFDDGTDDPANATTRVLFEQAGQPNGVLAGVNDRLLYGPTPYKGFPLRVRFYVVVLAREQRKTFEKLIDATGAIASAAQPEAAPAIGIILRAARLLNELTDDAFELRMDYTLYPVGAIGTADLADNKLAQFGPGEPVQRKGKPIAAATPLRIGGRYVIIKRETADRFKVAKDALPPNSTVVADWTQEGHFHQYPEGVVRQILRADGGILDWYVTNTYTKGDATGRPTPSKDSILVTPSGGPNAGRPTVLVPGIRADRFMDQTYATFSVTSLPESVDAAGLAAASKRDRERLGTLLLNPNNLSLDERLGSRVGDVASAAVTAITQRQIAGQAAEKSEQDPAFRTSTDYPAFWAARIRPLTGTANSTELQDQIAHDRAVLPVLRQIVFNLPPLDATDANSMKALAALTKNDFQKHGESANGLFDLTADGLKKLTALPATQPAGS